MNSIEQIEELKDSLSHYQFRINANDEIEVRLIIGEIPLWLNIDSDLMLFLAGNTTRYTPKELYNLIVHHRYELINHLKQIATRYDYTGIFKLHI